MTTTSTIMPQTWQGVPKNCDSIRFWGSDLCWKMKRLDFFVFYATSYNNVCINKETQICTMNGIMEIPHQHKSNIMFHFGDCTCFHFFVLSRGQDRSDILSFLWFCLSYKSERVGSLQSLRCPVEDSVGWMLGYWYLDMNQVINDLHTLIIHPSIRPPILSTDT